MTQHDEGYYAILDAKYARIIEAISKMHHIPLEDAMDLFYNSDIQQLWLSFQPSFGTLITA